MVDTNGASVSAFSKNKCRQQRKSENFKFPDFYFLYHKIMRKKGKKHVARTWYNKCIKFLITNPETVTSIDTRKLKFLDNIKVDLDHIWDGLDCNNLYRNSEKLGAFAKKATNIHFKLNVGICWVTEEQAASQEGSSLWRKFMFCFVVEWLAEMELYKTVYTGF